MKDRKNILITLLLGSLVFTSVLYTSCSRTSSSTAVDKCMNVTCKNNGICNVGVCSCPNGYEDADCGTASVSRYVGTWTMHDSVTGSDHPAAIGATNVYPVNMTAVAGSSIDFYINGITGNAGYQHLPCRMQDTLTRIFTPLQFRSADLYGYSSPSPVIIVSCIGVMNSGGYYIHGRYIKQYPIPADSTVENDTISYYALKQ